jgi:hypothetical protein
MDINDQIAYIKRLPVSQSVIDSILQTEYPSLFTNQSNNISTSEREIVQVKRKRKNSSSDLKEVDCSE